jgi:hypothetical protein
LNRADSCDAADAAYTGAGRLRKTRCSRCVQTAR